MLKYESKLFNKQGTLITRPYICGLMHILVSKRVQTTWRGFSFQITRVRKSSCCNIFESESSVPARAQRLWRRRLRRRIGIQKDPSSRICLQSLRLWWTAQCSQCRSWIYYDLDYPGISWSLCSLCPSFRLLRARKNTKISIDFPRCGNSASFCVI